MKCKILVVSPRGAATPFRDFSAPALPLAPGWYGPYCRGVLDPSAPEYAQGEARPPTHRPLLNLVLGPDKT